MSGLHAHAALLRSAKSVKAPVDAPNDMAAGFGMPYEPPKAAQKLNVGRTGLVDPNLNDPVVFLRHCVRSLPELVYLVRSAADDLGIDLDDIPNSEDDSRFAAAPDEKTSERDSGLQRQEVGDDAEL
ncbi:hypothetical protein M011DRAFT_477238 [Sporormia fimetaria CBS 119925]|uniref:Uncharacterized protein n=1 Tax=Sporormia fimetaria CBS 119925 TaxID=1340428 RepID=A0A6A6VAI5_9PLEO|nr:hypothetical protein M011DRAFT_477238 [Sporormia fimetaria CBS 119925]